MSESRKPTWHVFYSTAVCRVHAVHLGKDNPINANAISVKFERTLEGVANARLIAAAPDLLAALTEALEHIGMVRLQTGFDIEPIREKARAAIAKAEGR